MSRLLVAFITALCVAVVTTPLMRRWALLWGLVDSPQARKLHREPTPLLGGGAVLAAILLGTATYRPASELAGLTVTLLAAVSMFGVGIWDDRANLSVRFKLAAQALAAAAIVGAGVRTDFSVPLAANLLLSFIGVIIITNAFNLLDNMDGLLASVGACSAAGLALLAALDGRFLLGSVAASVAGACLGFARYNFSPATIFLGDSGSLVLGFTISALTVELCSTNGSVTISLISLTLVVFVPLLDTGLVVISRLRAGKNPLTTPGLDHLSHRLASLGLGHRGAVVTLTAMAAAAAGSAILIRVDRSPAVYAVAGTLLIAGLALALWLDLRPIESHHSRRGEGASNTG